MVIVFTFKHNGVQNFLKIFQMIYWGNQSRQTLRTGNIILGCFHSDNFKMFQDVVVMWADHRNAIINTSVRNTAHVDIGYREVR